MYYYGARYYDPRTSVWLGVDPLAEKYPGWSPYTYTLDNPIRFIDPDGRFVGDYVTWRGKKIGNDGLSDNNVHLVSSKESIKTISSNNKAGSSTNTSNVKIDVTTTKTVLKEAHDVLSRTEKNGGLSEESSVVTPSGEISKGSKGQVTSGGIAKTTLPQVEGNNNTSIHSHPTETTEKVGWSALRPGPEDPNTFKGYELNIIVGPLGDPQIDQQGNDIPRVNGAVLYNRNSAKIGSLTNKAVEKIIE